MATEQAQPSRTETFPVVGGLALRLSFTPHAIREHFDGEDSAEAETVASLDDAQLAAIAAIALTSDHLYETFHQVLAAAVRDHHPAT